MENGHAYPGHEDKATQGSDGAREIVYRQEWVNMQTEELVFEKETSSPETTDRMEGVVFKLITRYYIKTFQRSGAHTVLEKQPPPTQTSSRILRIYSRAIIHALQSMVKYYPSQSMTDDQIEVKWPYPILVHHYNQLAEYCDRCAARAPEELCDREKDASHHIRLLLSVLDDEVMESVRAERDRNARGFYTFENLWLALEPGRRCMIRYDNETFWRTLVVKSVSNGSFENPFGDWVVDYWSLDFNGEWLGRKQAAYQIAVFHGERDSPTGTSDAFHFVDFVEGGGIHEEAKKLVEYGKTWWRQVGKSCKSYKGRTFSFPFNEVNGFVMTDMKSYFEENPKSVPTLLDKSDLRTGSSTCRCSVCRSREEVVEEKFVSQFKEYCGFIGKSRVDLQERDYFLCPYAIPAFVLKTRTWEILHARDFREPEFDETMISSLAIDPTRVKSLKALAKGYVRKDAKGDDIKESLWGADFVKGKGSGIVFLLHGKPGVGKTCTAECIAHYVRRPLMVLSCSDIGTNPQTIEDTLINMFKRATSWGAVLLIDEADVFMERREHGNIERNSLVAAFLRALEFYEGMLFLTTNRVGTFDDAFISRVHIQIYYPELTDDQRRQIWDTFMKKLQKERGKTIRITPDVKDYIRGSQVKAAKMNGREIRNAFQTAVSMAEHYAEKDEDGKMLLKDDHLRAVLELSTDFKQYINNLHRADEDKRAMKRGERDDDYDLVTSN